MELKGKVAWLLVKHYDLDFLERNVINIYADIKFEYECQMPLVYLQFIAFNISTCPKEKSKPKSSRLSSEKISPPRIPSSHPITSPSSMPSSHSTATPGREEPTAEICFRPLRLLDSTRSMRLSSSSSWTSTTQPEDPLSISRDSSRSSPTDW